MWQYGSETHKGVIIAESERDKIVYCETGFGPSFPWGVLEKAAQDLGQDSQWSAYLYEAFLISSLYLGLKPDLFELKGPGERNET